MVEVRAESLLPWSPSLLLCCCFSSLWWEGIYRAAQAGPEGHLQSAAHPFITILPLQGRRHMHGGEGGRGCLLWGVMIHSRAEKHPTAPSTPLMWGSK